MNNHANTTLIIANVWLVGTWLIDDMIGWIIMIFMSLIWMLISFKASHDEIRHLRRKQMIQDLEDQYRFLKRCRDASIDMLNKKPKRKKK